MKNNNEKIHPIKTDRHPLNKNELDSRTGEEQLIKNGEQTHNKKEKHSRNKATKG